ncbi:hypothetical protein JTB14_017053 [Gonioctena quinquepunctata]|nr:hypothetical protein JTB14_017053 [Gonioctena quinquepunctata]
MLNQKTAGLAHTKNVFHRNADHSEKEFLVKLKTDPDTFGSTPENEIEDEGDLQEEKFFTEQPLPSQKLRTKQYADIIKDLIKKRKIKEAIDVVEDRMIKRDRVKPENYIYNLLLGACGRVGYTKKAFMIFNDMKKRGLTVTGGTYTALFNACANSPWPTTDGLTRARELREIMIEKGYEPNDTNYNAMIKAFGRCGDIPMAFALVDEMSVKKIPVKDDTINFLLQAVSVIKMQGSGMVCWCGGNWAIRDCSLGDTEVAEDVINRLVANSEKTSLGSPKQMLLPSKEINDGAITNSSHENCNEKQLNPELNPHQVERIDLNTLPTRPNLMAPMPHLGSIIALSEVTKPEERLLLVGGHKGFLDTMKDTLAAERDLLLSMRKFNVSPDVDFYNMLIKKRSMRFDYENAKEVLELMRKNKFLPDLVTYGVLALGCKTKDECIELVEEMKQRCYSLNAEITGAMLHQACYHMNFGYILYVMELCNSEQIQPNKKFMETLEQFKQKCRFLSHEKKFSKGQEKLHSIFRARYKSWRQEVQLDESEGAHPWQQYRQTSEADMKYKWKDTARFKPRHKSLFKVKTSTKVRN